MSVTLVMPAVIIFVDDFLQQTIN